MDLQEFNRELCQLYVIKDEEGLFSAAFFFTSQLSSYLHGSNSTPIDGSVPTPFMEERGLSDDKLLYKSEVPCDIALNMYT